MSTSASIACWYRCGRAFGQSGCAANSSTCRASPRRPGPDLVHSLGSTAPLWGRVPRVTTVHDLNYKLVPEAHFGLRGLAMRALIPVAVRRSRRVIVDAESTRRDLLQHLGTPPEKVDVVPLGVSSAPAAGPLLRAGVEGEMEPWIAARRAQRLRQASPQEHRPPAARGRPHRARAAAGRGRARIQHAARGRAPCTRGRARGRSRVPRLGPRRRSRRPVRARDVRRLPVPLRGVRPARARGDGARRTRSPVPIGRRCPRWPATQPSSSTRRTWRRSGRPSSGCSATPRCGAGSPRRVGGARPTSRGKRRHAEPSTPTAGRWQTAKLRPLCWGTARGA